MARLASCALAVTIAAGGAVLGVGVAHAQETPDPGTATATPAAGVDVDAGGVRTRYSNGCTQVDSTFFHITVRCPQDGPTQSGTGSAATTVVVTTDPAGSGTKVKVNAAVTPADAAGSVQFRLGSTDLGDPVPVTAGTASIITRTLSDELTATFIPSDLAAFIPSISVGVNTGGVAVDVGGGAAAVVAPTGPDTVTRLIVAPPGAFFADLPVTLIAIVTPGAEGTVQFKDGETDIGSPVPVLVDDTNGVVVGSTRVTGGAAVRITSTLTVGTHSLTAAFTPADPSKFNPSTSAAQSLRVTPSVFTQVGDLLQGIFGRLGL